MQQTPLRHMLFLSVLLFIILSSGSLQCALNCYEHATNYSANIANVANCHPDAATEIDKDLVASFCHHSHTRSEASTEPALSSISALQVLGLFSSPPESPQSRCASPFAYQVTPSAYLSSTEGTIFPLSQKSKQLRSTILIM